MCFLNGKNTMKIVTVRIGNKYGPEYETYLEKKLPDYEFIWVRKPIKDNVHLQWNKMYGMNLDIDEPICVMDIDILLINDYKKIFDYPIARGEFLAIPGWWRDTNQEQYKINGGFFKYYPKDVKYIYDKFMKDPNHWQTHYIKNKTTKGPINGEQYFVEDSVRERLNLKLLPNAWFTRWMVDGTPGTMKRKEWKTNISSKYKKVSGNNYVYLGGEFHSDIKMVHFTHSMNKPHLWKDYEQHI